MTGNAVRDLRSQIAFSEQQSRLNDKGTASNDKPKPEKPKVERSLPVYLVVDPFQSVGQLIFVFVTPSQYL